ncbi:twin transmembrane helix small protein [Rhodospirillaceae bacterium SYSU D60014]|uniref:twin transmembrane helix small protein n=1 Tax=Virgifigura deserti TaxID=2268457 RepID=UPI000E675162
MDILFILVIVAMIATLGALFLGMFSMARGGEFARRNSNRFMRWRVILQGTAIGLFILFVLLSQA